MKNLSPHDVEEDNNYFKSVESYGFKLSGIFILLSGIKFWRYHFFEVNS